MGMIISPKILVWEGSKESIEYWNLCREQRNPLNIVISIGTKESTQFGFPLTARFYQSSMVSKYAMDKEHS
jgi:hypothetical protein